jgi:hypothetical protein
MGEEEGIMGGNVLLSPRPTLKVRISPAGNTAASGGAMTRTNPQEGQGNRGLVRRVVAGVKHIHKHPSFPLTQKHPPTLVMGGVW